MDLVFTITGVLGLFGALISLSVMIDIVLGAEKIKSDLSEYKSSTENNLTPSDCAPRTYRLTGGLTPGKGMTYVPSDELIDVIR